MNNAVINIKKLSKSYHGFKAVDNLDFQVEKSECFGFLGPNGAGKTTTLKIIYGKSEPDKHKDTIMNIFGCSPHNESLRIKSFAGIVPQQDNLDTEAFQICDRIIIMDKGKKMLEGQPRELLSENLERFVLEIYDAGKDSKAYTAYFEENGIRYEFFQDTLYAYSDESERLTSFGERLKTAGYYLRSANLEDLFLKVTGRSLNELQ